MNEKNEFAGEMGAAPRDVTCDVVIVGCGVADVTEGDDAEAAPSLFPSPLATERAKRERLAAALDRLGGRDRFCAILSCSGRGIGPRRDESEKR